VFFDVDGTLVPRTSSSQYIASFLGHLEVLRRAEDAYAEGRMDNRQVSLLDAAGWRGRTPDQITDLLAELPLVTGIHEVVSWCREQDVTPYLATLAWEPVGRFLCKQFGFAGASGPRLAIRDGVYTGNVEQHFDEFDKRDFAIRKAADMGLPASACAAVGDSRSDLPLFADVGFSIAFNASKALRAVATACVSGPDLQAVIEPLERWLGVAPTCRYLST
jgi:phosphoserine phosphatase